MKKENSIILFNQKQIRRVWDEEKEFWYFSIVDIIEILAGSTIPKRYWSDLKGKLKKEGSEVSEKIGQLKMQFFDGKYYKTGENIATPKNAKQLRLAKSRNI